MSRAKTKELHCRPCDKPIVAGREIVFTAAGPMHSPCYAKHDQIVAQLTRDRLNAGTHSRGAAQHFCDGCRELVSSIWYVTTDRRRLCPWCAAGIGQVVASTLPPQPRQRQTMAGVAS